MPSKGFCFGAQGFLAGLSFRYAMFFKKPRNHYGPGALTMEKSWKYLFWDAFRFTFAWLGLLCPCPKNIIFCFWLENVNEVRQRVVNVLLVWVGISPMCNQVHVWLRNVWNMPGRFHYTVNAVHHFKRLPFVVLVVNVKCPNWVCDNSHVSKF